MNRSSFIFFLFLSAGAISQETSRGPVSGFVYDGSTGEALIGANVYLKDTQIGSSTNVSGYYSLPRVPAGIYTLLCTYIGYRTYSTEIRVLPRSGCTLNLYLEPAEIITQTISVVADSERIGDKLFRSDISYIQLQPRQIESIPQVIETDLLRSLQTMPGIAAVSDFSSDLYVRGGTPDQNLYLIDGTDVYNPEHFFGLFSTFNTDAIKNVEISKGGFGAEYGGRLSSVIDVTNLDGNRREYTGKVAVSLLSAKTIMQLPIGKFGSISGSFRRTYLDQTLGRVVDEIPDYYFYDGHIKAYFDISHSDKLTFSMYKGDDVLDYKLDVKSANSENLIYNWGNTTASLRWTHLFSPALFGNFWVTSSFFDSYFKFENMDEENVIKDLTLKGNLEYFAGPELNFKIGYEYKTGKGAYRSRFPGGEVDVAQSPRHFASYFKAEWKPTPLLEWAAGLRYNRYMNGKEWQGYDPRTSLKYRLTERFTIKAAYGQYHQYLFRIPRAFVVDIWASSDEYYDDAKSDHYILGLLGELSRDLSLEVETYYKNYENLYFFDPFFYADIKVKHYNAKGEPLYKDTEKIYDQGDGYAYGMEMLLRKDTGPVSGWISCTLGKTMNRIEGKNQGRFFPPRHDRTWNLNTVGTMDIRNTFRWLKNIPEKRDKKEWQLGFGFVYASGQPITTTSSVYVSRQLPDQEFYHGYNLYPTAMHNFRLPPYIRMDLSLTYVYKKEKWTLESFLQIFNLFNRKNVWFIEYDDELQGNRIIQKINTFGMMPLLPSIGITFSF